MTLRKKPEASEGPSTSTQPEDARLLNHYIRYIVREESGTLRERLQRAIVERALKASKPEHSMTLSAIQQRIQALSRLPAYPRELVVQTLNNLVDRGDVENPARSKSNEVLYRLSRERFEVLEQALQESDTEEQQFVSSVLAKIEASQGRLSAQEKGLAEDAFHDLVGRVLSALGEHCAFNLVQQKSLGDTPSNFSLAQNLNAALRALPTQVKDAARIAFEEVLRNPTPAERDYLYSLGLAYYIAKLLNLDPELQALQRDRFEETFLYLDTNLLLATLLTDDEQHKPALALVRLCQSAGFSLRYAERTMEELDDLLDIADNEMRRFPPIETHVAAEHSQIVANPFIAAYLASYSDHLLSWRQWRVGIAAWQNTLEIEGVTIDREVPVTSSGPRYRQLCSALGQPRLRKNGNAQRARRPRAIEHDAQMLTSIEKMNKEDDSQAHPFGHRFWFVTLDRRLVDEARRNVDLPYCSVCMVADEWVQYISPFLGPNVSTEEAATVFTQLLSSRFFVSLGASLTLEELQPFTTPKVDEMVRSLPKEEASRLIAEAAQRAARIVTTDEALVRSEEAIKQLSSLVERKIEEHKRHGDLLPREIFATLSAEKNAEIRLLREENADLRRFARWSVSYQWRGLRRRISTVLGWARARPRRLLALLAALGFVVLIYLMDWGGGATQIAGAVLVVLAALALDFEQLRANARRLLR